MRRLHSLPAAFTCPLGWTRQRTVIHHASNRRGGGGLLRKPGGCVGADYGVTRYRSSERARLPPSITGRLPERCLCAPLILPRERWRRADVTLSIQQQAVHNNGHKSPAVSTCTVFTVEHHISVPQWDKPQQSIQGKRVYHADMLRKCLSPAASTSMLTRLRPVT